MAGIPEVNAREDAQRESDRLTKAANDAAEEAFNGMVVQPVLNAIRAIQTPFFNEKVCAAILATLSAKIAAGNWSHTDAASSAIDVLDDLHDDLEYLA